MILRFSVEHGNIIAVLCANFQSDLTNEMDVLDERDFARCEFKMKFSRISIWLDSQQVQHIVAQANRFW